MTITFRLILMLLALIVFVLAAIQVQTSRVNLVALGLALWVMAMIAG